MYKKTTFLVLLFTMMMISCKSKKEVACPTFDIDPEEVNNKENKKGSKYSVVILKDGKKIGKKKKRRKTKNRLFKRKIHK